MVEKEGVKGNVAKEKGQKKKTLSTSILKEEQLEK